MHVDESSSSWSTAYGWGPASLLCTGTGDHLGAVVAQAALTHAIIKHADRCWEQDQRGRCGCRTSSAYRVWAACAKPACCHLAFGCSIFQLGTMSHCWSLLTMSVMLPSCEGTLLLPIFKSQQDQPWFRTCRRTGRNFCPGPWWVVFCRVSVGWHASLCCTRWPTCPSCVCQPAAGIALTVTVGC